MGKTAEPALLPEPWQIRPDQEMQEAVTEFIDSETCTRTYAVRQLMKRGIADWRKERAFLELLRTGQSS